MNRIIASTVSTCLLLLAAGCATSSQAPLDTGQRMSQRGGTIGGYGKDWSAGQAAVTQGEKSIAHSTKEIADGEGDLARAREQVAKAEKQIADAVATKANAQQQVVDGTNKMQQAEAAYSAIRTAPAVVE